MNYDRIRKISRMIIGKLKLLEENSTICCGISYTQCHALTEIGYAQNITLNELAQALNLDNSTMSRTVNFLVENGYVRRESNPNDRRYVLISLTEEGIGIFNMIEGKIRLSYERIIKSLPFEKREQILDTLHILLDAINSTECCGGNE